MNGFIEVTNSAAPYRKTLINVDWITRVEDDTKNVTIYLAEEFERLGVEDRNGFVKIVVSETYSEVLSKIRRAKMLRVHNN